jgi:feruloyl esterase
METHRPRNPLIGLLITAIAFAGVLISSIPAHAATLTCDIPTLQAVSPGDTTITAADTITSTSPAAVYCDVKGSIATSSGSQSNTVLFELGLPDADAWLGSFVFLGNGGYGGSLQGVSGGEFLNSISLGLAAAATDTGHESTDGALGLLDGSFGLNGTTPALAAREDFSYRAIHLSTVASQAITTAYYGHAMFSYFDGCSTGGRQALVEAQKFPTDYNGIVAGDPAIGDPIAGFNWNAQALLKSSAGYLAPSDLQLVDKAVMLQCDGKDGLIDGLIQDPRKCNFQPKILKCSKSNPSTCLNDSQIKTLQAIYAGAVSSGNQRTYPGYMASDPGGTDGWALWITGFTAPQFGVADPWGSAPNSFASAPFQWSFQDQFMKYFVFNDPTYNSLTFRPRRTADMKALNASVSQFGGNGVDTDLSAFFAAGGKLIMYHGWSDPAISPMVSVNYYTAMAKRLTAGDYIRLQRKARLFMVPGMHHCGGGPGPNTFDPLTPLAGWVQFGTAPNQIIATHYTGNDTTQPVDRTMPLCPYPQKAFHASGPLNDAAGYVCQNPGALSQGGVGFDPGGPFHSRLHPAPTE